MVQKQGTFRAIHDINCPFWGSNMNSGIGSHCPPCMPSSGQNAIKIRATSNPLAFCTIYTAGGCISCTFLDAEAAFSPPDTAGHVLADYECMVSYRSNACIRTNQMHAFVPIKCMQLYITNELVRVKVAGARFRFVLAELPPGNNFFRRLGIMVVPQGASI